MIFSRFMSSKKTENSPPVVLGCTADKSDAIGLVIAAENRGFCAKSAARKVEPERGKPEISKVMTFLALERIFSNDELKYTS